ncbi:DNA primase [Candidatus Woesearchaeota archaeon]|nr:DNA primase [Candidatus Woesearchaeota archaeon]
MAKIAQVSAKYIIHASIYIDGVVDRPDVIGAIFGQTEGLLGADLELRELQKSGRIGRIEVNVDTKGGKTNGEIVIPSSLDKAETSIVAAALEIIQRIGPCNAKIKTENIEDIRISKRQHVVERAKQLLKSLMETSMPDSQEIADEVAYSVRVMEIQEYGKERLPAGPGIDESDEIMVVEGRADVLTLLKHGFKNVIAVGGTNIPKTILDLCREKTVTMFVDGDRGGDLIIQEILSSAEVDFITKAPDGKEVEELTKKEIHKALRGKIALEQYKLEYSTKQQSRGNNHRGQPQRQPQRSESKSGKEQRPTPRSDSKGGSTSSSSSGSNRKKKEASDKEKERFNAMLEDLIGTRGAYILDEKLNILGKVPVSELQSTVKSLSSGIYAVIFDGNIDKDLIQVCERADVNFLIGMDAKSKQSGSVTVYTADDF